VNSRCDPEGLDTYEGQLDRSPWHLIPGTHQFISGLSGHVINRHKLDCRLGGGKHERDAGTGACAHCGQQKRRT
jgi:hypothetical protein